MDTRRPPLWWELPVALVGFIACTALSRATLGRDKMAVAIANAEHVLALERHLGLDVEKPANDWLAQQGLVTILAARHLVLPAFGAAKANAIAGAVEGATHTSRHLTDCRGR